MTGLLVDIATIQSCVCVCVSVCVYDMGMGMGIGICKGLGRVGWRVGVGTLEQCLRAELESTGQSGADGPGGTDDKQLLLI